MLETENPERTEKSTCSGYYTLPTAFMSKLKLFIPVMLSLTAKVRVTLTVVPALIV